MGAGPLMFRKPSDAVLKAWAAVQQAAMDFENEIGATNLEDVAVMAGALSDAAQRLENICDDEFAAHTSEGGE